MRIIVVLLLLLAAHFSLTPFAPAPAGKAAFYWPFAADSKPWVSALGALPQQAGSILTPVLAGLAGLGFLAAILSLFSWIVPANWWLPLIITATISSTLLYVLYFGLWSLIPFGLDAILLWGVVVQHWTVTGLRGI